MLKKTGEIVGDRALVLKDGSIFKDVENDPIHVRDLAILTKRYQKENTDVLRCNM